MEAKKKVRESVRAINPDVLALQEIGNPAALEELRASLKAEGVNFPYWEHVAGHDTNIHVAILSKFPFTARHPRTNETFLLSGRRYHVSRGFADVDIQVSSNYSFTLISGHLKSRRPVGSGDESELRLEEGRLLREVIEQRLAADPAANIVVLGDFNDTKDSPTLKTILGRGWRKLVDTRPAERNGDGCQPGNTRNITWTHYFSTEDSYTRIDYLLLSPGMAFEWLTNETYVLALPDWGVASDHRPITAAFTAVEK
jgi:endonuclease/exonuclease/phosphatase family metal-dependent hydrolase